MAAWRKTALCGVGVAALTAVLGLAAPQALVHAPSASSGAKPPAGYLPIKTRQGMCLDDTAGIGRDGQPVQLWKCLGDRNQAWQRSLTARSATPTAPVLEPEPPPITTPPPPTAPAWS